MIINKLVTICFKWDMGINFLRRLSDAERCLKRLFCMCFRIGEMRKRLSLTCAFLCDKIYKTEGAENDG